MVRKMAPQPIAGGEQGGLLLFIQLKEQRLFGKGVFHGSLGYCYTVAVLSLI